MLTRFNLMRFFKLVFIAFSTLLVSGSSFAEDPVRIGAIFSLSGWGATGGSSELNGAMLAQDDINAAGGIAGKSIKLIVEDNQSNLNNTASAFRKLESVDKVCALVGPNWSEFTEVVAPLAESAKIPFISPSGYKDELFVGKTFAFTLQPPHTVATQPLADLLQKMKFQKIAILLSENAYLEGILDALQEQLKNSGISFESRMRFNQGQSDFRTAITQLSQAKPDAVLALLTENGDLSNFFVQARQLKFKLPIFTANVIQFDDIIQKTPAIAEGATYFDFLTPGGAKFFQQYRNRFHREPGFASAKAYDAVFLFKAAIEKCGFERNDIRNCLSKNSVTGLSGSIAFDSNGVVTSRERNTELFRVENGKFVKFSKDAG